MYSSETRRSGTARHRTAWHGTAAQLFLAGQQIEARLACLPVLAPRSVFLRLPVLPLSACLLARPGRTRTAQGSNASNCKGARIEYTCLEAGADKQDHNEKIAMTASIDSSGCCGLGIAATVSGNPMTGPRRRLQMQRWSFWTRYEATRARQLVHSANRQPRTLRGSEQAGKNDLQLSTWRAVVSSFRVCPSPYSQEEEEEGKSIGRTLLRETSRKERKVLAAAASAATTASGGGSRSEGSLALGVQVEATAASCHRASLEHTQSRERSATTAGPQRTRKSAVVTRQHNAGLSCNALFRTPTDAVSSVHAPASLAFA